MRVHVEGPNLREKRVPGGSPEESHRWTEVTAMVNRAKRGESWWTGQKEEAALLVAQDDLTNEEIASRIGITRRSLQSWKQRPEFALRVLDLVAAMAEAVKGRGIAERQNRVAALDERWEKLHRVMAARARELADVPGGDTGLLVRDLRLIKVYPTTADGDEAEETGDPEGAEIVAIDEGVAAGRRAVLVAKYLLDVGLLRELREHEKQAAIELGQWDDKSRSTGTRVIREYVGVDVDQV
ncbi:MAG: hypothetical protein ACYC66_18200 [Chloroflexota bacterium]